MSNNGVHVLPRQASSGLVDAPAGYLELFGDAGTGKMSSIDESGVVTKYGLGTVAQDHVYYVGKHGSDTNGGKNLGDAVLTFTKAIQLAEAQTPSSSNRFVIQCVDGGTYTESFDISSYITIIAFGATIIGNITCRESACLKCKLLQASTGVAFKKTGDTGTGALQATGVEATAAGVNAIECDQGDLLLNVISIGVTTGVAILNSGNPSHIHGFVSKIGMSGAGTALKSTTGSGNELSISITEILSSSGTGIDIDAGHMHLYVGEFNPDTGGDVASGGTLTMFAADLYGKTFTGSGTIKVTEAGVVPLHASSHTDGTDDIQDASASQKGLATAAQITKLNGIQAGAQVNTVNSVFGRTGGVTAQSGDYSHGQITGQTENDHHAKNHASTHGEGGADALKLDDCAVPDDNTDLDANTSRHGLLPKLGGGSVNFLRADGTWNPPPGGYPQYQFFGGQLDWPLTANWPVNNSAAIAADSNNNGLIVYRFDDGSDEGVGFTIKIPSGVTNIIFDFVSRAETAPGAAAKVGIDVYNRGIPNNAAVESWSSAYSLTDLDIPTNENWQEDSQSVAISTLGITAGETTQFEVVRDTDIASDLTGDWTLLMLGVRFS